MAVTCKAFTEYLVNQQPKYDKLIVESIRPTDGWIGHVQTGTFPDASGVTLYQDRFEHVFPDVTYAWNATSYLHCIGTPCDKTEHELCWGASRLHYGLEEQSWATPLLCFDQMMHVTHAKEHFRQIISKILKPATSAIQSSFLRKRAMFYAGKKWLCDANMTAFTYEWQTVNDAAGQPREIYLLTSGTPTSKITPQHLQRRVNRLLLEGYFGEQPFKDDLPLIELVTDMETCWEADKLASVSAASGMPTIASNWRFQQWDAANRFWRYGFSGQLGNYAIRVDPFQLRFMHIGSGRFVGASGAIYTHKWQLVLPLRNVASGGGAGCSGNDYEAGLKSEANPDWENAHYAMSFIWHKRVMECLVADATSINPEMPFSSRNFGGRWQFVMDNLTCGIADDGVPIPVDNARRNKGKFIADFKMAIRPLLTEFGELIFHKREPACLYVVDTCASDSGYPTDHASSSCQGCGGVDDEEEFAGRG